MKHLLINICIADDVLKLYYISIVYDDVTDKLHWSDIFDYRLKEWILYSDSQSMELRGDISFHIQGLNYMQVIDESKYSEIKELIRKIYLDVLNKNNVESIMLNLNLINWFKNSENSSVLYYVKTFYYSNWSNSLTDMQESEILKIIQSSVLDGVEDINTTFTKTPTNINYFLHIIDYSLFDSINLNSIMSDITTIYDDVNVAYINNQEFIYFIFNHIKERNLMTGYGAIEEIYAEIVEREYNKNVMNIIMEHIDD